MHYDFVPISHRKPLVWPNGKRLAVILTDQSRILGQGSRHDEALLSRRPEHRRRRPARQRLRQSQLHVARVRPARRRVAPVRHLRCRRRDLELHDERQDGHRAQRRDRRGTRTQVGDHRAQLRADRAAHRPHVRREGGARGHPPDARHLRAGLRAQGQGLAVEFAALDAQHDRYPGRGRVCMFVTDLLNDDQPYLVQTRTRQADGVGLLHVGGQRLQLPAAGAQRRDRACRCSRSSSTGSMPRARPAAAS